MSYLTTIEDIFCSELGEICKLSPELPGKKYGEGDTNATSIAYRVKLFFLPATQGLESLGISASDDPEYAGSTARVR